MAGLLNGASLTLEDGFVTPHYADTPVSSQRLVSLIVDRYGAHYDASVATELEQTISAPMEKECLARAEAAIVRIRRGGLSKHSLPEISPSEMGVHGPFVLLVDQVAGDLSIQDGGATEASFAAMLEAAIEENPGHNIVVRCHPSARGVGPLESVARQCGENNGVVILSDVCSLWPLLQETVRLYTVSSHAGFEALLAGVPVICFGVPFYAGWGQTDDRVVCTRRNTLASVQHLFAAAYIKHSRYFDVRSETSITLENALDVLLEA